MNESIFTKIIKREIPAEIVWENEEFISILDIRPMQIGHTLLIPKVQVDKFYDLDEKTYSKLFKYAKLFAIALEKAYESKRVGVVIEGFGVPHTHIHLVPINKGNSLNPYRFKEITKEDLKTEGEKVRNALKDIK